MHNFVSATGNMIIKINKVHQAYTMQRMHTTHAKQPVIWKSPNSASQKTSDTLVPMSCSQTFLGQQFETDVSFQNTDIVRPLSPYQKHNYIRNNQQCTKYVFKSKRAVIKLKKGFLSWIS